nr:hypothetical protein 1 - silkworm transposon mag [Bombyx mori]
FPLWVRKAYDLLSTLASPSKPSQLTYANAVAMLAAHLQPKPSILAERYKFRQRRQLNESIADYLTELKKLSKNCEFGSSLDENLRDQMVCGLKSEIIRQRLFAEEKLEYKRAVTLALSLEAAERDAIAVERTPIEEVNKINFNECSRCGDRRHQAKDCIYKDYVCSSCHETGHLRRMCPKNGLKNQAEAAGGSARTGRRGNRGAGGNRRSWRGQRVRDEEAESGLLCTYYTIKTTMTHTTTSIMNRTGVEKKMSLCTK